MAEKVIGTQVDDVTIIESRSNWLTFDIKDLWTYRELIFFLTWRDIKIRYKQTVLGVTWAILQPILTMTVFSLLFGTFAKLPSDGIPYPILTFTALLPWQLFSYALTSSSNSLVGNTNLITKIYFPRLIIPISSVFAGLVDFGISFVILLGIMLFYRIPLTSRLLMLPLLILLSIAAALAVGLWLSALNVQYRDVRYAIPFLTQFWMYATPVAYSISLIPEKWRLLYSLNPMTGVVEGFRWVLIGGNGVSVGIVLLTSVVVMLLLFGGLVYFKRMENTFADVI